MTIHEDLTVIQRTPEIYVFNYTFDSVTRRRQGNMKVNRWLLVVAYHFPPVRVRSGVQRTLRFCTYFYFVRFHFNPILRG
jgi:hypothetical protein